MRHVCIFCRKEKLFVFICRISSISGAHKCKKYVQKNKQTKSRNHNGKTFAQHGPLYVKKIKKRGMLAADWLNHQSERLEEVYIKDVYDVYEPK